MATIVTLCFTVARYVLYQSGNKDFINMGRPLNDDLDVTSMHSDFRNGGVSQTAKHTSLSQNRLKTYTKTP